MCANGYLVESVALACSLLVLGTMSPTGAEAADIVNSLAVVDAHGHRVGDVIGVEVGSSAIVGFKAGQGVGFFRVSVNDASGSVNQVVFFESQDCTGIPFLDVPEGLAPASAPAGPGLSLYIAQDAGAAPQSYTRRSSFGEFETCSTGDTPEVRQGVPAIRVGQFTPPFRLTSHH
jgi:hypothetical protein